MEENKQELKGACFGEEKINLKQILGSSTTQITRSASNTKWCQTVQGWVVEKWGWAIRVSGEKWGSTPTSLSSEKWGWAPFNS